METTEDRAELRERTRVRLQFDLSKRCSWCRGRLTVATLVGHVSPATGFTYFFDDPTCKAAFLKDAGDTSGD